jgi:quercetin dioxygenase-like cupin family protein
MKNAQGVEPDVKLYKLKDIPTRWLAAYDNKIGIKAVTGDFSTVLYAFDKKGADVEASNHFQEQISYIIRGRVAVIAQGKEFILEAGDMIVIPPYVPHAFKVLEDAEMIEIFSPSRKELMPPKE